MMEEVVATPGVLGVDALKNILAQKNTGKIQDNKKNTRKYKIHTGVAGAGHGARGDLTALIVDILTI